MWGAAAGWTPPGAPGATGRPGLQAVKKPGDISGASGKGQSGLSLVAKGKVPPGEARFHVGMRASHKHGDAAAHRVVPGAQRQVMDGRTVSGLNRAAERFMAQGAPPDVAIQAATAQLGRERERMLSGGLDKMMEREREKTAKRVARGEFRNRPAPTGIGREAANAAVAAKALALFQGVGAIRQAAQTRPAVPARKASGQRGRGRRR
jgi:hypothetical protein